MMTMRLSCLRAVSKPLRLTRGVRTKVSAPLRSDYEKKYAEKLELAAKAKGLSVEDLHTKLKNEELAATAERRRKEAVEVAAKAAQIAAATKTEGYEPIAGTRQDSSPVRSLASVMNLEKILAAPHTSAQVSALWTAFHASRSQGTGRGYICAGFPVDLYEKMAKTGKVNPTFVVPLARKATLEEAEENEAPGQEGDAFEIFLLQWQFHGAPSLPSIVDTPALAPSVNPPISTVLFARMSEYQRNGEFATPVMVLTFYTELARTHGIILMRGEITPHSSGQYMLSQVEAQLLGLELQKFYLWGKEGGEAEALVKKFSSGSSDFEMQEIVDLSTKLA